MDVIGASNITVEKSSDGVSWTPMLTYYSSVHTQLVGTNRAVHAATVNYSGATTGYYRAKIILYAKCETGIGEMIEYTATIKL